VFIVKGIFALSFPQWVGLLCSLWILFHAPDAHTKYLDRLHILDLLRSSQFEKLELTMAQQERWYQQGKTPESHVEAAYLAFANSNPELENRFNKWVDSYPSRGRAHLARGIYYRNLGWITRGYRYISKTRQERIAGMKYYFEKARKDLIEAIRIKPNSAIAYSLLINIAMVRGDRDVIEQYMGQGLRENPRSFAIRWKYLSTLLPLWSGLSNEESLKAIQQFLKVSMDQKYPGLSPLQGFPAYVRAEILSRKKQKEQAIPYYEQSLSHGDYYWYSYEQASNFYYMGKYPEAFQAYTHALNNRPQVADIHKNRAKTLVKLGKKKEAMEEFHTALLLDSHDPDLLTELSYLLVKEGRHKEAIDMLERALILGPYDEYVVDKLGRVYLYELEQPAEGLDFLKRATELDPKRKKYWYNYGLALYQLDDCQAVPALHQYQGRCDAGGKCSKKNREWSKEAIKFLTWQKGCWKINPASSTLKEVIRAMFPF